VLTKDRANAARHKGNRLGIQYELCGTVQTRAQWLDAASLPTLKNAARQVARDCKKYGIPVRRLSVAETRKAWTGYPNGPKGIVGHVDCTNAYPEDGGDHQDPGAQFPWDVFLGFVQAEMREQVKPVAAEWTDYIKVSEQAGEELFEPDKPAGTEVPAKTILQLSAIWARRGAIAAAAAKAQSEKNATALEDLQAQLNEVLELLRPEDSTATTP
jgi:hypothetical protein